MRSLSIPISLVLFALALGACSSSSDSTREDSDGGGSTDASSDSAADGGDSVDAGACGGLANVGAVVAEMGDTQHALPKATGGTIVDGTYALTAATQYALDSSGTDLYIICGAGLGDIQETVRFADGAIQEIASYQDQALVAYSGTFTTSGTKLEESLTCPSASSSSSSYTATGNKILLIGAPGGSDPNGTCGPIVFELTLQS